jgi:hypothetical protein
VRHVSEKFIGTWKLVSFELRSDDQVTYPFGKDIGGLLMYNDEGYMSVALMSSKRRKFSTMDFTEVTAEEAAAVADNFDAYCGKYKVTKDKVIHLVEIGLVPNRVGEKEERFYKFEGDKLILITPPMTYGGKQVKFHATWKRVKRTAPSARTA